MVSSQTPEPQSASGDQTAVSRLFLLDLSNDHVVSLNPDGSDRKVIVTECRYPDGIAVDVAAGHIYWTNMGVPNQNDGSIESKARFGAIPGDELLHSELVAPPRMRGTEAVKDSGLSVIQIRQPQNDFARRRFPALLSHARGLHAADMHKVEQPSRSLARVQ